MPEIAHHKEPLGTSRCSGWLLMLVCLLGSGLCFWQLPSGEFSADSPTVLQAAPEPEPRTRLLTRKIQDIRPGMRVLADNPELAGQSVAPLDIQPDDWRLVTLEMPKADGSILFMEFLWELHELDEHQVADQVPVHLPELGIDGPATIAAIAPCPEIEDGPGRIVTGTFRHSNAPVLDLQVASEPAPLGTTPNHPFWSEDRQNWVQAGQLRNGEQLRLQGGTLTTVVSLTPRPARHEVYNLEVEGHHTYFVGQSGVLVHNSNKYAIEEALERGVLREISPNSGLIRGGDDDVFETHHIATIYGERGADFKKILTRQA